MSVLFQTPITVQFILHCMSFFRKYARENFTFCHRTELKRCFTETPSTHTRFSVRISVWMITTAVLFSYKFPNANALHTTEVSHYFRCKVITAILLLVDIFLCWDVLRGKRRVWALPVSSLLFEHFGEDYRPSEKWQAHSPGQSCGSTHFHVALLSTSAAIFRDAG